MASGIIGSLDEFKIGDDWNVYMERLDQYFKANQVDDERKVAVLITLVGQSAYKILKDVCDPELPSTKTYKELCTILGQQFSPTVSTFRKRIEFYSCRQEAQESVNEWYVRIKRSAIDCKFGKDLDSILTDKFITGLRRGPIQDRICEEDHGKTLKHYMEIALKKENMVMHQVQVNKISKERKEGSKQGGSRGLRSLQKDEEAAPTCYACGEKDHNFSKCKFKLFKCKNCSKTGHIAKVCKFVKKKETRVNMVELVENFSTFYNLVDNLSSVDAFKVQLLINNVNVEMEIDTGSGVSILPSYLYEKDFSNCALKRCTTVLKCYDETRIVPLGKFNVSVLYKNKLHELTLLVVQTEGPPLVGRDWIVSLKLFNSFQSERLNSIKKMEAVDRLIGDFPEVFKGQLGCYKDEEIKLELKDNCSPKFLKPRNVPFSFKNAIEDELERLEKADAIVKIKTSEWGTPLVPVLKKDGTVRLCADYKSTVNPCLKDVNYPIPRIEELLVALQGGKCFSKLDLNQAYNQLRVSKETGKVLAWSTHKGIYAIKRLPFGTKPACAIFQRTIEKVLQGARGTISFLDDILVTGKNFNDHLSNLREVLKRLQAAGLTVQKSKCNFFEEEIKYLGHVITAEGFRKDMDKVEAILKVKRPETVTEIKSFVGMVNYYGKFINNLATTLRPLYNLLKAKQKFTWTDECETSFKLAKEAIASDNVLIHFNADLPVRLTCDASQKGIGAVLSHILPNGEERPLGFASRVLNGAEKNYAMIDKEALAIYFGVKKFSQYLMGRHFELCTDHKPLLAIFGEKKSIPVMAAGRLQRWSLFLSSYNYTVKYIKGKDNEAADALSRLPLQMEGSESEEGNYNYLNFVQNSIPINFKQIRIESRKDLEISSIIDLVRRGWENYIPDDYKKHYFIRKDELTVEQEILMWGYRVVMPQKFRKQILEELYSSHLGIVKMKSKARAYFWWPFLDKQIEDVVKGCRACAQVQPNPGKSFLSPWSLTNKVLERIHVDYLGPFQGKMFLVVIDTFSKWPEVVEVVGTNATNTIEKLRDIFARLGLPKNLVSDNGPQFTSEEFKHFCKINGVNHILSPPYHPASNGAAENGVKSFKTGIKKALFDKRNTGVSICTLMSRYLFNYRTTIHGTTGETPAKLMFGRELNSRFDLLKPNTREGAMRKQVQDYSGKRNEYFVEGDMVLVRDYRNQKKPGWVHGEIIEKLGDNVFNCHIPTLDVIWKRHKDQLLRSVRDDNDVRCGTKNVDEVYHENRTDINTEVLDLPRGVNNDLSELLEAKVDDKLPVVDKEIVTDAKNESEETSSCIARNRPRRIVKAPEKLNLYLQA